MNTQVDQMKIPSLSYIYGEASRTIRRFPFVLLASAVAAFCAVWLIGLEYSERSSHEYLYKILLTSALGISLFTFIVLTLERKQNRSWLWSGRLIGLGLLLIYYLSLPDNFLSWKYMHYIRYELFFLGTHLLVAIAPFWEKGEINAFWQYNKTLFLRLFTAVVFSHVLYIGLVVAMLSVDNLFGVKLPDEWYGQLWVLIAGIFNTWFFLSGVPENLGQLENYREYPKVLKIITQYILIPLVIIYLVILYLYAGKIIIEWQWPEGWVAILTLSFSVAGIFSLLLLYPIQEKVENRWIKSFSMYYYISLVPLVIMLLLAIWRRISEYGFTENRYFVLILGIWLSGIVVYFIFSSTRSIKVIPGSLCIITFLISFGPWGAFSISENSQINRLESLLSKNQILVNGQIQKAHSDVPDKDAVEISAVVRYLINVHGLNGIQPWFDQDLEGLSSNAADSVKTERSDQPRKVVELMGLQYFDESENNITGSYNFTAKTGETLPVEGYEWLIKNQNFNRDKDTVSVQLDQKMLLVELNPDSPSFTIHKKGDATGGELKIELGGLIEKLNRKFKAQERQAIPQEQMHLEGENDWIKVRLNLNNLNIQKKNTGWTIQNIRTDLLISFK